MKNKLAIMLLILSYMIWTTGCGGSTENSSTLVESSTEVISSSVTTSEVITTTKLTSTTVVSTSAERETETTATTPQSLISSEDAKKIYKDYFLSHYDTSSDLVCLKDVTHDGTDDMIIICHDTENIVYSGIIYTLIPQSSHLKNIQF